MNCEFDVHRAVHRNIISVVNQLDAPTYQIYYKQILLSAC